MASLKDLSKEWCIYLQTKIKSNKLRKSRRLKSFTRASPDIVPNYEIAKMNLRFCLVDLTIRRRKFSWKFQEDWKVLDKWDPKLRGKYSGHKWPLFLHEVPVPPKLFITIPEVEKDYKEDFDKIVMYVLKAEMGEENSTGKLG